MNGRKGEIYFTRVGDMIMDSFLYYILMGEKVKCILPE